MQKPPIPLSHIRDLRCRHCQNFLSCGPTYVVPDNGILCGRCQNFAKTNYRNYSYEALASIFLYPCQFWEQHCPRSLEWNESLEHEDYCSYNGCCRFFCSHPGAFCASTKKFPTNDLRLQAIPDGLLDNVKCCLCECYLSCDPVYIQENGQNICHRCVNSNGIPPNCPRNIAYEKLARIIIFPCIYRNRGCPTKLRYGRELWQHETDCSYGQVKKITTRKLNQKEKGVIQTHSGHYYGTITPNTVPFAPPSRHQGLDLSKDLIKSLKHKQDRKYNRVNEGEVQFARMNSEESSIASSDNRIDDGSDRSSPTIMEDIPKATNVNQVPQQQYYRDNRYSNVQNVQPQRPNINGYQQYTGEEPYPGQSYVQGNYQQPQSRPNYDNYNQNQRDSFYNNQSRFQVNPGLARQRSFEEVDHPPTPKQPSFNRPNNINFDPYLAGHYPVFNYNSGNGNISQHSSFNNGYNRGGNVSRTDSLSSNRELIGELKAKQQQRLFKNNSILEKEEGGSPYKECKNLEDIKQVMDGFGG